MNLSERIAKAVVEHIITGSSMRFRSDQSSGEYDFDLGYADRTVVTVEVTMSSNQQMKWSAAKLSRLGVEGLWVLAMSHINGTP